MNTSAWTEQVDTALVTLLKDTLIIPDAEVDVFVTKPDKDFYIESYPCAAVHNLYTRFDEDRYYPSQKRLVSLDTNAGVAVCQDVPLPFKLNYQIDFWSKFKTDMNLMSAQWLSKYPNFFNLPIIDEAGNERSLFAQRKDSFTPRDYFEKRERIFHANMTYEIWGDLDYTVPVSGKVFTELTLELKGE